MTARSRWVGLATALLLIPLAAACSGPDTPTGTPNASPAADGTISIGLGERPFTLHVPASYDKATAAPLVILLHGYTASGQAQESYMKFIPESDKRGFLYAYPDGLVDTHNNRFWNATDACCNLYGSTVDDSAYVSSIITKVQDLYTVDAKRVYLIGHSNGAFMSFRMACDHADQVTAIAALNGAMWDDPSKCKPSTAVSILDIRSTADDTIKYSGGTIVSHTYPSAATTDKDWIGLNQCSDKAVKAPALDLVNTLDGAETSVLRYSSGCASGSTVETWTIAGGAHVPAFGSTFASLVMDFLLAQAKPQA